MNGSYPYLVSFGLIKKNTHNQVAVIELGCLISFIGSVCVNHVHFQVMLLAFNCVLRSLTFGRAPVKMNLRGFYFGKMWSLNFQLLKGNSQLIPGEAGMLSFQDMAHWPQLLIHHQGWIEGHGHYFSNTRWTEDHSSQNLGRMDWGLPPSDLYLWGTESCHCNNQGKIPPRWMDPPPGNSKMKPGLEC